MPHSMNASGSLEALRYRLDAILHEIECVGAVSPALSAAKATIARAGTHIENHFKAEAAKAAQAIMDSMSGDEEEAALASAAAALGSAHSV